MESVINLLKKYHLYLILLIVGGGVLVNSYFIFFKEVEKEEIAIVIEENNKEEKIIDEFYVDIKGYIKKPGVYLVKEDTLVNDLIKMAGGITKNGTTANLNLSKKLTSEMVIIINSKSELKDSTKIITIKEDCVCDTVVINECLDNNDGDSDTNQTAKKVSINNATLEELMSLSGIGESKAKAIISYRSENGLFKSIEDIMNVSGIGEAVFVKIKENITI